MSRHKPTDQATPFAVVEQALETRAGSPGDKSAPDEALRAASVHVEELALRLHAQQGFIDALDEIMHAGENPPSDSAIMAMLESSLASVIEATESEDGAVLVRDEDADRLVFVISRGHVPSDRLAWTGVPRDKGIAHWVLHNRKAAIVNNVSLDERFYAGIDKSHGFHTRSVLAAPIIVGDRVIGVVEVLNKQKGALYTVADQHRLELLCHFDGELLSRIADRLRPAAKS